MTLASSQEHCPNLSLLIKVSKIREPSLDFGWFEQSTSEDVCNTRTVRMNSQRGKSGGEASSGAGKHEIFQGHR